MSSVEDLLCQVIGGIAIPYQKFEGVKFEVSNSIVSLLPSFPSFCPLEDTMPEAPSGILGVRPSAFRLPQPRSPKTDKTLTILHGR
jgi:hypothetical protein